MSFEDIAAGALSGEEYSLIVCSYALHLVARSRLPTLMIQLAGLAPSLCVLSPHKRPHVNNRWGWQLTAELLTERTRARLFRSVWTTQCG